MRFLTRLVFLAMVMMVPRSAFAQADEIQVYDGGLAPRGVFNLTLHTNYIASGIKTPAFPGAVTAHKSLNGVPEWAFGVTDWFEAGLYMPLYSRDNDLGWGIDGFKLRTLFGLPDGDNRKFVLGLNVEYSFNAKRWDTKRFTSEFRPIVGWHFEKMDLIFNPIIDTSWDGLGNLEFVPATRVAFDVKPNWQIAGEIYSGFGHFNDFAPKGEQTHQLYFVVDKSGGPLDIEFGVGVGLTDASDKLTFKVILARDLIKKK